MTIQIGFDPANTLTSAERLSSGKGWAPGSIARDRNGNEWMFVQAGAAVPQNTVVRVLASAHQAVVFSSAGIGGTAGAIKAYAVAASASIASGSYGWVMTKGTAAVKCIASGTGTYVPTAAIYAAGTGGTGLVTSTASSSFALVGMSVAATATTSTTASTIPVVFYDGIQMTSAAE
jgi:hypothetical protein